MGAQHPCFIIAEIAQAHDGSLGAAHAYIDAVATTGAQAIKFQTHYADEESTPSEPWRIKFSKQDKTRFDYWKRMEFSDSAWEGLADHCKEVGLVFLSSAFSMKAVRLLDKLKMPAWKIASGEISNEELLKSMAETGKPILYSTGMSTWEELDTAIGWVKDKCPVGVFQTTTSYPCPPEKLGLNLLQTLKDKYTCPIGLSDHSAQIHAGVAAAALGAKMIEIHVVFDKHCFGPDTSSSLTVSELKQMVEGVRFVETALAHPIDKNKMAEELKPLRDIFKKSIVINTPLEKGTLLERTHLAAKKPGTGLCASKMDVVIGRRLTINVEKNHILQEKDFA